MKTVNETLKSEDYPYGRLRTTKYFEIEFKKSKGFRTKETTINPKTNQLNKPHNSTYNLLMYMSMDENGFVQYHSYNVNSFKGINEVCKFVSENFDLFTPEQINFLSMELLTLSKVSAKAQVIYCGTDFENLKPLIGNQVETMVKIIKEGKNLFNQIVFDIDKIESLKISEFNPFNK